LERKKKLKRECISFKGEWMDIAIVKKKNVISFSFTRNWYRARRLATFWPKWVKKETLPKRCNMRTTYFVFDAFFLLKRHPK